MQFGIDVAQQRLDWDDLVTRARFGEECGFTGAWGFDHFQPMYGEGPGNCFEGMATLAALATATTRIRLGLLVTGVTYRHPSLFAAQAMTIDHASHGRLDLSFGAAWFEPEHRALGFEFPSTGARFDLLDDTLEIATRLMTGEPVSYDGTHVSLHDAQMRPAPVQQPHPPFWIGANGPKRGLPAAARWADGGTRSRRPSTSNRCRSGSTSLPKPPVVTRRTSRWPHRCRSPNPSTRFAVPSTGTARSGSRIWCVAGPARGRRASPSSQST